MDQVSMMSYASSSQRQRVGHSSQTFFSRVGLTDTRGSKVPKADLIGGSTFSRSKRTRDDCGWGQRSQWTSDTVSNTAGADLVNQPRPPWSVDARWGYSTGKYQRTPLHNVVWHCHGFLLMDDVASTRDPLPTGALPRIGPQSSPAPGCFHVECTWYVQNITLSS
jgi:hypothetical protein